MRIVYFYQYFSTDKGSWGTRVYDFAKEWVTDGHKVTVVTSLYAKSDLKCKRFRLVTRQSYDKIDLIIINLNINNKHNKIRRIFSFIVYALVSSVYALFLKADVVIASSGPITVGIPGLVSKLLRRRKLVFEVRDLWPQGAIELGYIKNKLLQRMTYFFEKYIYLKSDLVVTLSPGMKSNILNRYPVKNIVSITNSVSIDMFSTPQNFIKYEELVPKKYAIYTGNIGYVNNSLWLLEAARILERIKRVDLKIFIIGDGPLKPKLIQKAREENLSTLIFKDLSPKIEIVPFVQNALVSLVPLKQSVVLDTSSPNKLFESIAAGVPVIQNSCGWIKDYLSDNNLGYTINASDAEGLVLKLVELDSKPNVFFEEFSSRAKLIAAKDFDKKNLANQMLISMLNIF